jgi:lysophospholipid acyltransferase
LYSGWWTICFLEFISSGKFKKSMKDEKKKKKLKSKKMSLVGEWSEKVGFPEDQLRYVLCMLATIPLGLIYQVLVIRVVAKWKRRGTNESARRWLVAFGHCLSIAISIGCLHFCLPRCEWLHSFVSSLAVYILLYVLPSKHAHIVVFLFLFVYMSASHIYRMSVDYMGWTMDFTGAQMILTLKLSALAMNLRDGRAEKSTLNSYQAEHAVPGGKLCSPLEFFGYVYFFPSFLAGPCIEFMDFRRYVGGDTPLPPTLWATLGGVARKFGVLALLLPTVALQGYFPVTHMLTAEWAAAHSLPVRLALVHVYMTVARCKYYFAWSLGDITFASCGYAYQERTVERDGKFVTETDFDRAVNVAPLAIEFPEDVTSISRQWNRFTHLWLKHHVFFRLVKRGQKPTLTPTIVTYLASAVWHGFYAGYSQCFVMLAFVTEANRDFCRFVVEPRRKRGTLVDRIICAAYSVLVIWLVSYAGALFTLLGFQRSLTFIGAVYGIGHIIPLLLFLYAKFFIRRKVD